MKLACTGRQLSCIGATTLIEKCNAAASLGYDGVHLECGRESDIDPASFSLRDTGAIVQAAVANNMQINSLDAGSFSVKDPEKTQDYLVQCVCIAHALAIPLVSISAPPYGEEDAFRKRYRTAVDLCKDVLEYAEDLDICLGIRPAHATCVATVDEALDFIDDIDQQNMGFIYPPVYLAAVQAEPPEKACDMAHDFMLMILLDSCTSSDVCAGKYDNALNIATEKGFSEFITNACLSEENAGREKTGLQTVREHLTTWHEAEVK